MFNVCKLAAARSQNVVKLASQRRGLKNLIDALDDPETAKATFGKLKTMGKSYGKYVKYTAGVGASVGAIIGTAHVLDVNDVRPLRRTEMIGYPLGGTLGGAFVGATFPVWVIFAPVGYVLGYENMAAIGKLVLAGTLLSDDE